MTFWLQRHIGVRFLAGSALIGRLLQEFPAPSRVQAHLPSYLFAELGNAVGEAGHFPAGVVLMYDTELCRPHNDRLRCLERCQSRIAVAALDRFLDFAHRIS
jgi:hypothetical protein